MFQKVIKILLFAMVVTIFNPLFANESKPIREFNIRFWKIPNLTEMDFYEDKNETIFKKLSYESGTPIRFYADIKSERGLTQFTYYQQNICYSNSETGAPVNQNLGCLSLDTSGRDFDLKKHNLSQFYKNFDKLPHIYVFDKKLLVMFVDLTDDYFEGSLPVKMQLKIKQVMDLSDYLLEITDVSKKDFYIIGNFGVEEKKLNKAIKNKFEIVKPKPNDGDMILKRRNGSKTVNSQFVLKYIGFSDKTSLRVRQDVLNDTSNLDEASLKISPYLPIDLKIEFNTNVRIR